MAIRNSAKAILINKGQILVNRCQDADTGETYFDLPGGGQHPLETMENAVMREVLEETGYEINIIRFAALAEEISLNKNPWQQSPDYAHRIHHIFLAELSKENPIHPSERDFQQKECIWLPLNEIQRLVFRPRLLNRNLDAILASPCPVYLGSSFEE
ncbi:MAG TPA: NUDIX domain-containing protein [Firmicutes bacterium]|nr:NUDIX domain-containing protein [Bacillota bacterium]